MPHGAHSSASWEDQPLRLSLWSVAQDQGDTRRSLLIVAEQPHSTAESESYTVIGQIHTNFRNSPCPLFIFQNCETIMLFYSTHVLNSELRAQLAVSLTTT
jgi:hypothetical protein